MSDHGRVPGMYDRNWLKANQPADNNEAVDHS